MGKKLNVPKQKEIYDDLETMPSPEDFVPFGDIDIQIRLNELYAERNTAETIEEESAIEAEISELIEKTNSTRDDGFGIEEGCEMINYNQELDGSEGYLR